MLFIGASFTQDSVAYVPMILEELLPGYDITIGICYTGSATLAQHVEWFDSATEYQVYSEWTTANGVSVRTCADCGIVEKVYTNKTENEANPNTGAPVLAAVVVLAAAAVSFKK